MRRPTLAALRARLVADVVREEVERFLLGELWRRCAFCGHRFKTRHRWHFLCDPECRKRFYAGAFRPRPSR